MTFHCLPSQNCLPCRQRRIKCDRARPECSQCKRAHKECTGYRDEVSLLFRDENERIIRRAKAAHERSRVKAQAGKDRQASNSQPENATFSRLDSGTAVVPSRPMPMTSLDIDNLGLQFCYRQYTCEPGTEKVFPRGFQQHMLRIMQTNASFRNAVVPVGLATLSNVNRDPSMLTLARQRYGTTLKSVRSFVTNQSRGDMESLFYVIIAMAVFETVDEKPGSLSSRRTHLAGIAALLKQSSFAQRLKLDAGAESWYYLAVIVDNFHVSGPFPAELNRWPIQRPAVLQGNEQTCELIDILIEFVRLRSSLRFNQEAKAEVALRKAVDLEKQLQSWKDRLPADRSCTIKEAADKDMPGTFYGQYHVYQDAWAHWVLLHYSLGRLLVNEVIVTSIAQIEEFSSEQIAQRARALAVINQMAADICIVIATHTRDQRGLR
ncbi:Zn(II)2Cys6 transcription factor domain-containing protein [Aspergillus mulundensis]|uniref:Zn(2)-C6 fungal-type domain-containing protein n=1 Tax=Aspergillus mulundensis TaxID=1810919 RepID=A0A3D8RET7_9EURO|nr:hypothetical protein DSM5745_07546 [Aspergillus mulundensis]RDW72374.1 hypothetical protein DSM5745_07546 [Aspergillus mulundensis]